MDTTLHRSQQTVPLPTATHVHTSFNLIDSNLYLAGGAVNLLDAEFIDNHADRPLPYVNYQNGQLVVTEQRFAVSHRHDISRWQIKLNDTLPLDLAITLASGAAMCDLDRLSLKTLTFDSKSGDVGLRLGGNYAELTRFQFNSTSGDVKAILTGEFSALQRLDLHGTSSDMQLGLLGIFQQPFQMSIKTTSGDVAIDFGGTWQADLNATLSTVSGDFTLVLPDMVGVVVGVHTRSGNVKTKGFKRKNREFINEAFGHTAVILKMEISTTSGNITLIC